MQTKRAKKGVKLTKRTKERMNGWTDGRRPSGSVAVLLLYCLTGLSSSIVILPNYFALSFTHLSQLLAYFVVASFMTLDKRNCIIRIACCTLALVSLVLFFTLSLSFFSPDTAVVVAVAAVPSEPTYLPLIRNEFSLDSFVYDLPCSISVSHAFGVLFCK